VQKWIAFLMMSWGAVTTGTGGVRNYPGLVATRFLLGVFEAGLFPGLVYYLTFWYRSDERSLRVALIMASSTLAGAFGGAIAYGESAESRHGANVAADCGTRHFVHERSRRPRSVALALHPG